MTARKDKINNGQKPQPYVGITGFKTKEEIRELSKHAMNLGYAKANEATYIGLFDNRFNHKVMFGFHTSTNKLNNRNKEGKCSSPFNQLAELLREVPKEIYTTIHHFTHDKNKFAMEVCEIFSNQRIYNDGLCRSMQINMDWPELKDLEMISNIFPEMEYIIQIPARAMEGLNNFEVLRKILSYRDFTDYILLDPSGGKGQEYDFNKSVDLVEAIDFAMPNTTVGIAAGFSAENVYERVTGFGDAFYEKHCGIFSSDKPCKGYFSIDAQGQLRYITQEGKSLLSLDKTKGYLTNAKRVFE